MCKQILLVFLMGVVCQLSRPVLGHARFWEPPGRSTMWRRGYSTPINYNDNQLFCGGFSRQVNLGYKCGTCGDPYDGVRENEAGGKYATGKITRTYSQGQEVTFQVDVTANHKGFFEFKICATNDPTKRADQDCLDQNVLELADGSGTRFTLPDGSMMMDVTVRLPAALTCDFCVIQMRYHAGNSWGKDPGASQGCLGCGYQEEFYGCADVRILPAGSPLPGSDSGSGGSGASGASGSSGSGSTTRSTPSGGGSGSGSSGSDGSSTSGSEGSSGSSGSGGSTSGSGSGGSTSGSGSGGSTGDSGSGGSVPSSPSGSSGDQMVCYSISAVASDQWCQLNCQGGYCPSNFCQCQVGQFQHAESRPAGCRAAGAYASLAGYDDWCRSNCALGNCPASICIC